MSAAQQRSVTVHRRCITCNTRFITKSDTSDQLCPECKASFNPEDIKLAGNPILSPMKNIGKGWLAGLGSVFRIPGYIPAKERRYRRGGKKK